MKTLTTKVLALALGICSAQQLSAQAWSIDPVDVQIFTNTGVPTVNVGIRTAEPSEALEVVGNSLLRGQVGVNTSAPAAELSVRGQMTMSTTGFATSTSDKISLYGDRLGQPDMAGLGFETSLFDSAGFLSNRIDLYYKAENAHRFYVNNNANGGVSAALNLYGDRAGLFTGSLPQAALEVESESSDAWNAFQVTEDGNTRFMVRNGQFAGFGTNNPLADLHIVGNSSSMGQLLLSPNSTVNGSSELLLGEDDDFTYGFSLQNNGVDNRFYIYGNNVGGAQGPHFSVERDNGDIGVGYGTTVVPSGFKMAMAGNLLIRPDLGVTDGTAEILIGEDEDNGFAWRYDGTDPSNSFHLDGYSGGTLNGTFMTVDRTSGSISMGYGEATAPAGYQLAVDGAVICEELVVEMSADWPDYVFEDDYELRSIQELESEINRLGHLPGIPSAETVEGEGLELGAMQKAMMEKIEEMSLYIIELQHQIDDLKSSK
jgi:hypothetical protein